MMDSGLPDCSWLRFFGEELRTVREERGLTLRELAAGTTYSFQQLSNVEAARRTPSEALARELDRTLGTGDRFQRILKRVLADTFPTWFKGVAHEEGRACEIRIYEPRVVPGLLQIEEYTRARLRWAHPHISARELDKAVADRAARQEVFARDTPPCVWVILDESVLHRPIGGPAVMARQLHHLAEAAERPNLTLQVVPLATPDHAGLAGPLTLWTYPDRADAAYTDHPRHVTDARPALAQAAHTFALLTATAQAPHTSLNLIRTLAKETHAQHAH
ncbi:Helix-turn-helix domain-containing protein [Actinacidiphila guanduensis]|uniref:Helix-turn-helix domain-containing protein n=1 Tax=Actinacidiphila guanduensis TaxID=310781 RepID=A0A1H0D8J0_9ACTN|nr:Helix-turn-helix domain-containing protein [Actinacidiphila guanduensis]